MSDVEENRNNELLPCPFCGSVNAPTVVKPEFPEYSVLCYKCGAKFDNNHYRGNEKSAIEKWNTRANLPTDREARLVAALESIIIECYQATEDDAVCTIESIRHMAQRQIFSLPESPKREVGGDWQHPVFAFLLGEGELEHRGFGDEPPVDEKTRRRIPFWWRKHLREALAALQPKQKEMGGEDAERLKEENNRLRTFADSFSVTCVKDSFYKDCYLTLKSPHSLHMRLPNTSDKSWLFIDLEERRIAALIPKAGEA